ncbi:M56 family metallopeptidase [Telluria mixta]|uniref:M56 family metallopeptidase n=1 Tax=Telluria mixta TaxID=34071 RepID=A0ABT2BRU2_9BURK|nr:M56 family metallopeptidase [Telluria mixta]MCS0627835.1 M56 family metallopeptidase [Telluria mixta]WEM94045.1 M56 family metallopeptidase [Telluria mixta]
MSAGLVTGLLSALLPTSPLAPLPSHLPSYVTDVLTRLLSALANGFVPSLGWALLHFVWQGALIGCATAVLLVALRNARPERRYAAACFALLLCVVWPAADFVTMLLGDRNVAAARALPLASAPAAVLRDAVGLLAWLQQHLDWIVGAWAACAAALGLRMALGLAWVGRATVGRAASPHAGSDEERVWQTKLARLAARCGIDRQVRLRIVDSLASPVTAGFWRPVVLVPAALVTGMPPQLLEALLAHELGHVRRHDYLVNLVQNVIEALLFYHPAVWWISRRIRHEREQIADDFAARQLGEPRRLAQALSELERLQFSGHHLAQAAAGGDLMARIRRLVRPDPQALDWRAAIPVLGLVLACAASAHALATRDAPVAARTAGLTRPAVADFSSCTKPQYPQADIAASHEGTVTLNFRVDASGFVTESTILRSSGYASMDEAARGALHRCRFAPALRNGQPVSTWQPVQYVWTLA